MYSNPTLTVASLSLSQSDKTLNPKPGQVACFSQSDELWLFFTDQRSIVGVPPELEEENARHAQVLPTDNEP